VWLHPATGQVLARHRFDALDPGARGFSVIYPLHTGELGGPLHEAFNLLLGLACFGFGASGTWLWWNRRRAFRLLRHGHASPSRAQGPGARAPHA
jgi:uncharacterized iron-regulated membrane protein